MNNTIVGKNHLNFKVGYHSGKVYGRKGINKPDWSESEDDSIPPTTKRVRSKQDTNSTSNYNNNDKAVKRMRKEHASQAIRGGAVLQQCASIKSNHTSGNDNVSDDDSDGSIIECGEYVKESETDRE